MVTNDLRRCYRNYMRVYANKNRRGFKITTNWIDPALASLLEEYRKEQGSELAFDYRFYLLRILTSSLRDKIRWNITFFC